MNKWPDGTPKSTGNAFDWRDRGPSIFLKPNLGNKIANGMAKAAAQGKAPGNTQGKAITIKPKKQ
jgi:hypothetical protein